MPDLMERLKSEAHDFNFFRAVLLCEEFFRKRKVADPIDAGKIRFTPDPSITFPPNDITSIGEECGTVRFTLAFMGLVGVTSPLPVYFSEYIASHPETAQPLSDFLAIFNHRIYTLFYRAWKKYHFLFNFTADGSDPFTGKVAMLSGSNAAADPARLRLLAYCGILAGGARSSAGLATIISDYFGNVPVAVEEFASRWAPLRNIKPLGAATPLGRSTILGTTYFDRASKFKVVVGPLKRLVYERFLPGTRNISEMKTLVDAYLSDPLDYDIVIQLESIELVPVVLGADRTRLGETSSLGRSDGMTEIQSITIH